MKKHFKKVVAILLLLFSIFLVWLDSYEPKKEPFKHSDFYIENIKQNEEALKNSKLKNPEYRKYLEKKIQEEKQEKEREKQEQEQEQEKEKENQEQEQERKREKKKTRRNKERKNKEKEEESGKIKEKTKRARIKREQENNRLDKYIFKHKMKSKKRP